MEDDNPGEKTEAHKREIRRRKVRRLFARGAGPAEIAAQVKCSRRTVYRDLEAIEDEIKEELDKFQEGKLEDFLSQLVANYDTVNEELWTTYSATDNENVQLGALKLIMSLQEAKVDVLQKMGILDKVAEQLDLDVSGSGEFNFNVMQVSLDDYEEIEELLGGKGLDDLELKDNDDRPAHVKV